MQGQRRTLAGLSWDRGARSVQPTWAGVGQGWVEEPGAARTPTLTLTPTPTPGFRPRAGELCAGRVMRDGAAWRLWLSSDLRAVAVRVEHLVSAAAPLTAAITLAPAA